MSDISVETHEFRQGNISRLFSSVRDVLQITIDDKRLRTIVAEKIRELKKLRNNNNQIIQNNDDQRKESMTTDDEDTLEALVLLCKTIFSVIFVKKNDQITLSIYVRYYGEKFTSFNQCVYLMYDQTCKHYNPLYIFNKTDQKREKSIFDRKNDIINTLLREFFKQNLKYLKFVQLDDQVDTTMYQIIPQIQNDSSNRPSIITSDPNVETSDKISRDDECSMAIATKTLTTNRGNRFSSNTISKISTRTHKFRRGNVLGDGSCLYSSARKVLHILGKISNENLRKEVANKIRQCYDIHVTISNYHIDPGVVELYCDRIENHNAWGGEREFRALSILKKIVFGVLCVIKTDQVISSVYLRYYGEKDQSSTKCVYIIYDQASKHYEPLYLCKKNSSRKEITIFNRYDPMINALLDDFIKNQLKYNGPVKFDEERMGSEDNILDEPADVSDSITSDIYTDKVNKEKTSATKKLPMMKTVISTSTHQFRIGEVPGEEKCLFSSTLSGFDRSEMISIKNLRKKVANFIRQCEDIDDMTLLLDTNGGTREDYCLKIEEGIRWGDYGYVKFDDDRSTDEDDRQSYVEHEPDIFNLIAMNTNTNTKKTKKRKNIDIGDDDHFLTATPIKKLPSISNTNDANKSSRYARSLPPNDAKSTFHSRKDVSNDIALILPANTPLLWDFTSDSSVEQRMEESPIVILANTTSANVEQKMILETSIIKTFRGRTTGNFIPKKKKKRDGTESKTRKPIYFSDIKNRHRLNLLISNDYLSSDLRRICLEICIITRDCIHIHPYFKFPLRPKDHPSPDINPLYIYLGYDDEHKLGKWSETIQNLLLYLAVIMLTNNELMQNQPLKLFPSSRSSRQQVSIKKYENSDEFKSDFSLNEMRIAFTIWIEESCKKGYYRHEEMQYISSISIQDQNAKVQDNNE